MLNKNSQNTSSHQSRPDHEDLRSRFCTWFTGTSTRKFFIVLTFFFFFLVNTFVLFIVDLHHYCWPLIGQLVSFEQLKPQIGHFTTPINSHGARVTPLRNYLSFRFCSIIDWHEGRRYAHSLSRPLSRNNLLDSTLRILPVGFRSGLAFGFGWLPDVTSSVMSERKNK